MYGLHGPHDKRRDVRGDTNGECFYRPEPCPHLFDFYAKEFNHKRTCPNGDKCTYAHNRIEIGFHPLCYKTENCPYYWLSATNHFYEIKECPFQRSSAWFENYFGKDKIKNIKGNKVSLTNGLHLCLDYCPFFIMLENKDMLKIHPLYIKKKKDKDKDKDQHKNNHEPMRNDSSPPSHREPVRTDSVNHNQIES